MLEWYIFDARNAPDTSIVFLGLLAVVARGRIVENGVFLTVERHTLGKWDLQR